MVTFEVRSGRQTVAVRSASTAQEALVEYLRGLGCRDDEIKRLGTNAASWRGAMFKAVPATGSTNTRRR